ncbi:tRNA (guanosine(46)-N7)-methyltransferase TrmB [Eubacteriaceae bacterium ES3]|nr:tRNA (guanosine(46)-N7)-methyltransferase TrmB [Eubacteriaceae bacterium ES3]
MHLRIKPWARPELEASHFFQAHPQEHKGHWQELFKKSQPLQLELGCGKGNFIAELGSRNPQINYLAIDLIDAVLGLSKRNIETVYQQKDMAVENIQIMSWDIERLDLILSPADQVERIYINFCNPWPKRRHHKKRLTHPKQLEKYKNLLVKGGQIHFKTDNDDLFDDSIKYFQEAGFKIIKLFPDLHTSSFEGNIETEHEKMFSAQGVPIKFLIAVVNE